MLKYTRCLCLALIVLCVNCYGNNYKSSLTYPPSWSADGKRLTTVVLQGISKGKYISKLYISDIYNSKNVCVYKNNHVMGRPQWSQARDMIALPGIREIQQEGSTVTQLCLILYNCETKNMRKIAIMNINKAKGIVNEQDAFSSFLGLQSLLWHPSGKSVTICYMEKRGVMPKFVEIDIDSGKTIRKLDDAVPCAWSSSGDKMLIYIIKTYDKYGFAIMGRSGTQTDPFPRSAIQQLLHPMFFLVTNSDMWGGRPLWVNNAPNIYVNSWGANLFALYKLNCITKKINSITLKEKPLFTVACMNDGKRVAYIMYEDPKRKKDAKIIIHDLSGTQKVLSKITLSNGEPKLEDTSYVALSISPQDKWIALTRISTSTQRIWLYSTDGKERRLIDYKGVKNPEKPVEKPKVRRKYAE